MKTVTQLFRQPIKTVSGIVMVAVAVAVLVTCVGQYAAAKLTRANLDDGYDTVALLSDKYFWEQTGNGRYHYSELPDDIQAWVDDTIQNRTDLVQTESFAELFSAYIPGVSPDNFSQHENGDSMDFYNPTVGIGNPYRCAMLEVTVTAVGTVIEEQVVSYGTSLSDMQDYREYISMLCVGTVEQAIGLEQGFLSPVGKTIVFTISVYNEEELDAMELEAGQRYLVYGMDYSDVQGEALAARIRTNPALYEELFGAVKNGLNGPEYDAILEQIDCYMSVCDYAALPIVYRNNGGFEIRTDLRENSYRDGNGILKNFVPAEEYMADYSVPTVVKLEDTAESYLASEAGAAWRQALEEMEINNHGFPVLAVDKLGYQVAFARGEARIVEGRDFTEAERINGSRVCVISESVAAVNSLSVGDTIDLQTYALDFNIKVQNSDLVSGTRFPSAALYSRKLGFSAEMEQYTIVGIYRQTNAWQNREDPYGFTPNVIFVPKGSISGDCKTETSGIFYTLVLENGKMEEFRALQSEAGYPDLFVCMDQGFTEIVAGLDAYEEISRNALLIGIAGCGVIMLLFLILFPFQQRKVLATMSSLGAPRGRRIGYLLSSSVCILVPGILVGGAAGLLAWSKFADKLMETVNVQVPLEANMAALVPGMALAVLTVMMGTVLVTAVALSGSKGLMKRR